MAKEQESLGVEPKVEKKKVCPVCNGKGYDDNSSEEDTCNHCLGTGKWKELK